MSKQSDIEKKREDIIAGMLPSIRTCVQDPSGYTPEDCAGDIMAVLDFKGVVIKVDRELPEWKLGAMGSEVENAIYKVAQKDMAGYVAVKPLIGGEDG